MSSGRRRKAAASNGASTSKKARVSEEVAGDEIRWEWEGDAGCWTAYSTEHATAITDAYNQGENNVILDIPGGVKLVIVLDRMKQKNKKTGWERRVRCCVKDGADMYGWQWKDEHGNWNPYGVKTCHDLEAAYKGGKTSLPLTALGRAYTIDVSKMEQVNDATSVARTVERAKSSAVIPKEEEEDGTTATVKAEPETPGSKTKSTSRGRSGRGKVKEEVKEEEEEEEAAASTSATKSRGKSGKSGKSGGGGGDSPQKMRTIVVKGSAPVDPECTAKVGSAHVFTEGKDIYDVMLNQTNLQNNNNKYYVVQLLEDDGKKSYSVWQRWGRVGYKGQTNLVPCGPDLDQAKKVFIKKFEDKTKNDWSERKKFKKVAGKYDMVTLDYSAGDAESVDEVDSGGPSAAKVPDSKLDERLQRLINLICDVKNMEDAVVEMKYDAKKAPLGKLTTQQIKAGYAALKIIDECVSKNDFGQKLVQACDQFYTRIPHDFGMQRPPVIRSKETVKLKIQLLEALGDIEIAMKIIKHSTSTENPVDTHYKDLKCDMEAMDKAHKEYKLVEEYLQNTHATTHSQYKMQVLDVFNMDKHGEKTNFKDVGNRMLLWHGSRITNWVGILSKGLRIAPPEAPVTGYMFGKGVYFADMSSKSANYTFPTKSKNVGLILLCEVALGNTNELLAADYRADKIPAGKHSVTGVGKIAPDPSKTYTLPDGCKVPIGKGKDTGVTNPHGYTLNYNEFIVYDTRQIKMRYLVKVQFNFR